MVTKFRCSTYASSVSLWLLWWSSTVLNARLADFGLVRLGSSSIVFVYKIGLSSDYSVYIGLLTNIPHTFWSLTCLICMYWNFLSISFVVIFKLYSQDIILPEILLPGPKLKVKVLIWIWSVCLILSFEWTKAQEDGFYMQRRRVCLSDLEDGLEMMMMMIKMMKWWCIACDQLHCMSKLLQAAVYCREIEHHATLV